MKIPELIRRTRPLLVALLVLPLGGCITMMGRLQVANGPTIYDEAGTSVYPSTICDLHIMCEHPFATPFVLLDIPFAVVVDTVMLPYDAGREKDPYRWR